MSDEDWCVGDTTWSGKRQGWFRSAEPGAQTLRLLAQAFPLVAAAGVGPKRERHCRGGRREPQEGAAIEARDLRQACYLREICYLRFVRSLVVPQAMMPPLTLDLKTNERRRMLFHGETSRVPADEKKPRRDQVGLSAGF